MSTPAKITRLLQDAHNTTRGEELSVPGFVLLCLLQYRNSDYSPSRLSKELGMTTPAMTGHLDRLQDAGWIARSRHPKDRRKQLLTPTAKARHFMREAMEKLSGSLKPDPLADPAEPEMATRSG